MLLAEVQFYNVVIFFHILAVVFVWGPTFAYPVFFATAGKTNPAALPTIGRAVLSWSRIVGRLGILVLLASGIYLVEDAGLDYGSFFISWGIAAILVLYALIEAFFIPNTKRFIEAVEAGRQDEAQGLAARQRIAGPIAGLLVILTIYVMTAKPFL